MRLLYRLVMPRQLNNVKQHSLWNWQDDNLRIRYWVEKKQLSTLLCACFRSQSFVDNVSIKLKIKAELLL